MEGVYQTLPNSVPLYSLSRHRSVHRTTCTGLNENSLRAYLRSLLHLASLLAIPVNQDGSLMAELIVRLCKFNDFGTLSSALIVCFEQFVNAVIEPFRAIQLIAC